MSLRLAAEPRNPETLEGGPRATARALGRASAGALGLADRIVRARGFRIATRTLVGVAVLVAIVLRVGAEPFVHGLLSLDLTAVIVAVALFAVATAAAAWRWTLIARRLGATLRWRTAVGMYYRSQLVNTLLPGGVIGDVQRAVDHGRASARSGGTGVAAASRAVAIERVLGQAVQVVLTIGVLAMVGAEFEGVLLPCIGIGLSVIAAATAVALRSGRVRRALRREGRELVAGLGSLRVSAQAVAASIVVFGCHLAISSSPRPLSGPPCLRGGCSRSARSCCSPPPSRSTSAAGGRGRARRAGRSPSPASAQRPASRPRRCTACSPSWPSLPVPPSRGWHRSS